MFIVLFVIVILLILFAITWSMLREPKPRSKLKASKQDMPDPDRRPQLIYRQRNKQRSRMGIKYVPGELGLSTVSRQIKKDFGSILSRAQRKHYSKSYGIPFVIYASH